MSRDISANFETQIEAKGMDCALFVKAEFDSGDVRIWTGIQNITFNSETYLAGGNLLGISEVAETQALEANGVQFTLSGIPSSYVSVALSETYQWRPITMWFAVLSSGTWEGYQLFSGKMNIMEIADDGEYSSITVFAESDLITAKKANERRYTGEDQKQTYPSDLGLDFVPLIQDYEIVWGRS